MVLTAMRHRAMPWLVSTAFCLGCAHASLHRERMGAWGTVAPRVYRNQAARDEITILLETPAYVAIVEQTREMGAGSLAVVYPADPVAERLEAGRHRLTLFGHGRHIWAPEVSFFILAFDRPISARALFGVLQGINAYRSPNAVRKELERGLAQHRQWEGFFYQLDMYTPGGPGQG